MKQRSQVPLAIIGMACRLPGADDLGAFWRLLIEGRSAVAEVPPERLNRELYYAPQKGITGKSYTQVGALVSYPPFDTRKCPIPTRLMPEADVVQLAICQVAAEACRHAGMNPFDLPVRNVGVYIGHTLSGELAGDLVYSSCVGQAAQLLRRIEGFDALVGGKADEVIREVVEAIRNRLPRRSRKGHPFLLANLAATIISEAMQLTGPAMVVDAACSSSLQCLALAARALRLGQIEMAIVGGASYVKSDSLVLFSQAQSVTAGNSCPFDAGADGLVAGEGQVAVVVKTLPRALADRDRVLAVIRGIGVSSDGRGKSLWAPRREGQLEAIRRAYAGGLEMHRLQYVEAHATSTQAGDVTEMAALAEVLAQHLPKGTRIPVGGVKANIGHTLESAGLAGLIKTVLAIEHQVIPRQINLRKLNPEIDWEHAPFFVPTENLPWPAPADGGPRRAAVNAFGVGGLNVHVVLDEFLPSECRSLHPAAGVPHDSSPPQAPVAIVGMSCIFPGARTVEAFWDLLVSGKDPKVDVPLERWDLDSAVGPGGSAGPCPIPPRGGFITDFQYDWRKHKVPPKQIARADPLQFMILDATDAALRHAGYDRRPLDKTRVGVVVGTMFGSDFSSEFQIAVRGPEFQKTLAEVLRRRGVPEDAIARIGQDYGRVLFERYPALLDETGSFTPSTLASRITKSFDLMGGALSIDAGQCSAPAALATAIDWLRTGECDMIVCAAGSRAMGLPTFEQLSMAGYLAAGDPKAPFDAQAGGFVPGEGVGVVLLKRLSDAQRDGDTIYGIVRGVAAAYATSARQALETAIRRALHSAGARPQDVSLVETAAAGNPRADRRELAALANTYGQGSSNDPVGRKAPLLLGSSVAQMGHLQGAAGMASLIKAVLELQRRQVPPMFGLDEPAPWLDAFAPTLEPACKSGPLPVTHPQGRALAAVDCVDVTGLAAHIILERPTPVPLTEIPSIPEPAKQQALVKTPTRDTGAVGAGGLGRSGTATAANPSQPHPFLAPDSPWKIVRLGAADWPALAQQLENIAQSPEQVYGQANGQPFGPADRCRVAIVASHPAELAEKARLASTGLNKPELRPVLESKGIFHAEVPPRRPLVAFMFAGQGSQYAGMLRGLVQQYAPAARAMERLDQVLVRLGFPTFAQVAWDQGDALGSDVWRTQLSLLVAETILYSALVELGIRPDRISSHSYGEFPALLAAGAWTFEADVLATHARCQVVEQCQHAQGGMLSVAASMDEVQRLCQESGRPIYVANWNAPRQTVVGGDHAALDDFEKRLRAEGIAARRIPVPRPFHTPLMSEVKEPFRKALQHIPLQPPRIPLLSSVSNRYVAEPDDIRDNLASQMATNVRYVELVRRLADEGVGLFVEVGPNQVLTGLHRKILEGRPVALVASDNRKSAGVEQLLHVQACAEVIGALDDATSPIIHPLEAMFAAETPAGETAPPKAPAAAEKIASPKLATPSEVPTAPVARSKETVSVPSAPAEKTVGPPALVAHKSALSPADTVPEAPSPAAALGQMQGGRGPVQMPADGPKILVMHGTPYEMGLAHGRGHGAAIRRILRRYADLPAFAEEEETAIAAAAQQIDVLLGPEDLEEMRGIADGAEVALSALVAHNLRIYPDHGAGCVHFAVSARCNGEEGLIHAGNDDVPLALLLRHCLERNIQVRFPHNGIPHICFAMAGQMAASIGINACGLAITGAMLLDRAPTGGKVRGRMHSAVVKRLLQNAETIDQAIAILRQTPGAGAWGICLTHYPSDQICYVEYDGDTLEIGPREDFFTGANHSLLLPLGPQVPMHSRHRLARLQQLVGHARTQGVAVRQAQAVLRDRFDLARGRETRHPTMNTLCRVDNQLSAVMQPGRGKLWVTRGPGSHSDGPTAGEENYIALDLRELMALCPSGPVMLAPAPKPAGSGRPGAGKKSTGSGPGVPPSPPSATAPHGATAPVSSSAIPAGTEPVASRLAAAPSTSSPPHVTAPGGQSHGSAASPAARSSAASPTPGVSHRCADPNTCDQRICHRYVLRMVAAPLSAEPRPFRWQGRALIVGNNPVGQALAQKIRQAGTEAIVVGPCDSTDEALAALERFWAEGPALHLFLVTPHDADAATSLEEPAWSRRQLCGVRVPFYLCQRWLQLVTAAGKLAHSSAMALTALGGDFGFSGRIRSAESGALAGLIKALRSEVASPQKLLGQFRLKVVDAPADTPPDMLARALLRELAADDLETEIAYVGGKRYVARPFFQAVDALDFAGIRPGGTWVITGGARGITAAAARELALRFGLKLHLIGSSPPPAIDPSWRDLSAEQLRQLRTTICREAATRGEVPIQAWRRVEKAIELDRNLRQFAELGISAVYHCCDVSDRQALARVLEAVRHADGPIQGIVHGAGVESAGAFVKKKQEIVEATLAVKVGGAANLMALTSQDPIRFFVSFGSTSGRFGGTGQADYSAANEMLAKLVGWYRQVRPDCRAVTFHWHGWDEIGMAARPEARNAPALRGMRYMPPREGVTYLVEELLAGAPEREVLVTDHRLCVKVYPEMAATPPSVPAPRFSSPTPATASDSGPVAESTGSTGKGKGGSRSPELAEGQCAAPQDPSARPEVIQTAQPEPTLAAQAVRSPVAEVASRYVARLEAADVPGRPLDLGGPAWVLGDCAEARALARRIEAKGGVAHCVPLGPQPGPVLAELERLWSAQPAPHLFLLTAREPEARGVSSYAAWLGRRGRGVLVPFEVCRWWSERIAAWRPAVEPTLLAVTALGGDFGFTQTPVAPEGGFLAGLLKSFHQETLGKTAVRVRVKVLDAPTDEPAEAVADACLAELAADDEEVEVAWRAGHRYRVVLQPQPASLLPQVALPRGGTWVATGGARGITAAIALELGRRCALKFHLLGRSPLPQVDPTYRDLGSAELQQLRKRLFQEARLQGRRFDWDALYRQIEMDRSLRAFAAAGVPAVYHQVDVADRQGLARVLDQIRRSDGPITGILHGAGIAGAICRLGEMKIQSLQDVLAAKVESLLHLVDLTADDPLEYILGFGSITGRFGSAGRTDYASACELQAKLLGLLRRCRPACRMATIHWHPWAEVGMMMSTRAAGVGPGVPLMPKDEGVRHLIEELQAGTPEPETVVVDLAWHRSVVERLRAGAAARPRPAVLPPERTIPRGGQTSPPDDRAAASGDASPAGAASCGKASAPAPPGTFAGSADSAAVGAARALDAATPASGSVGSGPALVAPAESGWLLLAGIEENSPSRFVARVELNPQNDPFLHQHRFRDRPLLPIVVASEMFAEAAAAWLGKPVRAIRKVDVHEAVRCFSDDPVAIRIVAEPVGKHTVACRLVKDVINRAGQVAEKDRIHLVGEVEVGDLEPVEPAAIFRRPGAWYTVEYPEKLVIYHGPVLRCLKLTSILEENEGWGWIVAPDSSELWGRRTGRVPLVPAAVLDACFYTCGIYVWVKDQGTVAIPQGYGQLRLGRPPAPRETCLVRVCRSAREQGHSYFDFTLYGADNAMILQVERYHAVAVAGKDAG